MKLFHANFASLHFIEELFGTKLEQYKRLVKML